MRSELSLRIPSLQELSPPRKSAKATSLTPSCSAQNSPKPSEFKSHQRTPTNPSAYKRITSNMSIKKISLPTFLQTSKVSEGLLSKLPMGKGLNLHHSDSQTDTSSVKTLAHVGKFQYNKSKPISTAEDFIEKIFEVNQSKDEILVRIGKIQLTRADLQSLKPRNEASIKVVDACLRCIKKKNRKCFKSTESHDRVLIVNTGFSSQIFCVNKDCRLVCQRNPLKYEFILFPVYIQKVWVLAALDNRHKSLKVYNARNVKEVNFIYECVALFVKRELKYQEKKEVEVTGYRELRFETVGEAEIENVDSGIYIIRIAYEIAVKNQCGENVSSLMLNEFRYNLLVMIFKNSHQIASNH